MSLFRASILVLLALTGCGADRDDARSDNPVDPATRLALQAPLLVDPDLTTQNRRFAVLSDPARSDGSLPLDDFAPASIVAARAEARSLSGPPDPRALGEAPCPACTAPTLAQRSGALGKDCGGGFVAALEQGARMPTELPIYPRAHLREAGATIGAGQGACAVRAASFTAPASPAEVLAFYRGLATKTGFALRAAPDGSALLGRRPGDGARFAVIARAQPAQTSQIDLIVAGL